jgi:cell division inhibitor SepF
MAAQDFLKKLIKVFGVEEEEPYEREEEAGFSREDLEEEPLVRKIRTRKPSERVIRAIDGEGPSLRVFVSEPRVFNDVQEMANRYRLGVPVILNLQSADDTTARRILDFASGMVYALKGGITPIGERIYMLTPRNVEITPEDRRRLRETFFRELGSGEF